MVEQAPTILLIFIAGACLGSFINVVSFRYGQKEDFSKGRSRCQHCGKELTIKDLIPIVSFTLLRGRCRHCKAHVSIQYPIVEASMGVAAVISLLPLPITGQEIISSLLSIAIVATLIVLLTIDLRTMILPDIYIMILGLLAVFKIAIEGIPPNILEAILIGSGFLLALWSITLGRGIGFGDVKLMIPLAILVGFTGTITLLFVAFIAGGFIASLLLVLRRANLKTAVPFGPYLIGAALLIMVYPDLSDRLFSLVFG